MVQAVDFAAGVEDAWSAVAAFVPKLVAFLVILLIGWLVAKAVEKILDKALERVGFDRWVERGGVKRALANSRYDASSILGRLVARQAPSPGEQARQAYQQAQPDDGYRGGYRPDGATAVTQHGIDHPRH